MFKAFFAASLFSIASVLIVPTQTAAQTIKQDHVEVRLISGANAANDSTKPLEIGVHFKIDSEWHVYWKNPGDSGAAPKFELTGAKLVEVNWPYPSRIPVAHLTNYGYDDEVVIFLSLAPESEEMKLNLEWLVCKIECIPGFGEFNFTRSTVSKDAATFGKFRARVPAASDDWLAKQISVDSAHLKFELEPLNSKIDQIKNVFVFPENGTFFQTSLPAVVPGDHSLSVSVPLTPNATVDSSTAPEKENFTFVIENKDGTTASFAKSISARKEPTSWLMGLLLAVLGGFILNLMPCVFPVLFLKAFGFLKESDPRAIRRSSWAYSIGVVISFLAFGGLLTGLRFAGEAIGWGYQLQNPWLVYLLALLFFSMALSFYGYFEFGDSLAGRAGSLGSHRLFNGSFGTGVLAVVVASPCTAPFMGTALGLTLLLPIYQSLAIFAALGIGMAAPMLLLGYAPGLIKKLPRSGAWMITVKQLLSFPLFATSLWLLWVLEKQKGADAVFISLLSFLLVCVAIWLLQENRNRIAKIFGFILLIGSPALALSLNAKTEASSEKSTVSAWAPFDENLVAEKRKTQSVFIDFTASWCITCQVNKRTVLDTKEIQDLFKVHDVFLIRADWTNQDPKITQALASFGRNSVPFYVFYNKMQKPPGSPQVLPELLTKDLVKEVIQGEMK